MLEQIDRIVEIDEQSSLRERINSAIIAKDLYKKV